MVLFRLSSVTILFVFFYFEFGHFNLKYAAEFY